MNCIVFDAPVGPLGLEEEGGALRRLYLPNQPAEPAGRRPPVLAGAGRSCWNTSGGSGGAFTVPLEPRGTPFQRRVWDALAAVPWGKTVTYGALAGKSAAPGPSGRWGRPTTAIPCPSSCPATGWWGRTGR